MGEGQIAELISSKVIKLAGTQIKDYLDIKCDKSDNLVPGELVIKVCPSLVTFRSENGENIGKQKCLCVRASSEAEIEGVKCGNILRALVLQSNLQTIRQLTIKYVTSDKINAFEGSFLAQNDTGFEMKGFSSDTVETLFDDQNLVSQEKLKVDSFADILTEGSRIVLMYHLASPFLPKKELLNLKFLDTHLNMWDISFYQVAFRHIESKKIRGDKEETLTCTYRFGKLSSWKASGSGFTGVQKLLNIIDKIKSEETSTRVGSAKRLNNDVARIGSAKLRSIQTCANTQNISVGCEDISEKNEIQAEKVSTSNLIDHPKQIKDIDEIIITSFVKSRSVTFNGSVTEIPEKNTDSENSVDHSEDRKSGEKNNEELAANIKTQDHKGETTYENPFPTDQNGFKLLSKDEIQLAIDTFFAGNLWEDFEFVTDMDRKPTQKYSKFVDIGRKPNAYRSARRKNGGGKLGAKLGVNALLSTQISTYCKSFEHLAQELQKKTDLTAEIKRLERADLLETDGEDIGIESLFENKTKIKTENPGSDTESVKDLQNLFEEPLVNIQKVQIDTVNVGVNPINFGAKWPSTTISSHEDKKENIAISTDEDSIFDLRDLFDEEKLRMAESSEAVSQSASPNEKVDDTYLNTAENFVEAKLVLPEPARDINGNSSSTKEVQKSEIDERETLDEDSIFDLSELFEDNLRSVKSDETVSQGAITAENVHDTVENFADVKAVPRSANSVGDISSSTKEIQKSRNNERKIQNEDSTDNESVMNIGGLFDEDLSLKSCSENRQEASIANQKSEEKLEETAGLIETHNSTITDGNPQKSYDQMVMENFFSRKEPEQPIVDDGDFVPSLNSTTELTPNDSGISDDCDSVVSGRGKSRNPPMPGVNSFNFILESDRKVIAEVHSQIEKESNQPMKQLNLWYNKIELPNDTEDDLLVQVPHKNLQKNRRKREKRRKAKQKKKMEKCCCHCQHHKYASESVKVTTTTARVSEDPRIHFLQNFDSIIARAKEKVRAQTAEYIGKHPELKTQLISYLVNVLKEKPEDLPHFAAQFFAQVS